MAKLVGARERLWKVLYDTICFGEGHPAEYARGFLPSMTWRLFNSYSSNRHYGNVDHAGCMPADQLFKLCELGLRVDMDGPIADDMLHALLRALRLRVFVADREIIAIPPGGFYPPGMTETVEGFVRRTERASAKALKEDDIEVKPLLTRCENRDETPQLWAAEENTASCGHVLYPSAHGVEIGGREQLGIQLRLTNGRVWFEASNDGEDWIDITTSLFDLTRGGPLGLYEDCQIKSFGVEARDFLLSCDCYHGYLRARWEPTGEKNALHLEVLARGRDVLLPCEADDLEPPWLRGGFCRFIPVNPAITIPSHQSYSVELSFDGVGARRMAEAANEGLLRGEIAVLLGGVLVRDIM